MAVLKWFSVHRISPPRSFLPLPQQPARVWRAALLGWGSVSFPLPSSPLSVSPAPLLCLIILLVVLPRHPQASSSALRQVTFSSSPSTPSAAGLCSSLASLQVPCHQFIAGFTYPCLANFPVSFPSSLSTASSLPRFPITVLLPGLPKILIHITCQFVALAHLQIPTLLLPAQN